MNTYAIPEYLNGMVEPKYVERVPEKKIAKSENKIVSLYLAPAGNKKRLSEYLLNFSGKNSELLEIAVQTLSKSLQMPQPC